MDPAGLPALLDAIRHMHGCKATWLESVPLYTLTEKGRDEVKAILSANKVTAKEQLAM